MKSLPELIGIGNDWQPMETAPKDGTVIRVPLLSLNGVRVYWDDELKTWVLCHSLHLESIQGPLSWKPE